ncbi:MAG: DUF433 domain-containing protein [Chloroflexi bacterium]|nr:DUF433 domain-containing protein [Chloroflexota bacterium]MDA1270172.1 DUF433 domain-containing protein [Chloroflexota bacterium]
MPTPTFEEVWERLKELEGKTIITLGVKRPNRIVGFSASKMIRQTRTSDGKGWKEPTVVPKSAFRAIWEKLAETGVCEISEAKGGWYVAAACLVEVPKLGVELLLERKHPTIELKDWQRTPNVETRMNNVDEDHDGFGDLDRIVVDPDICSGKPTIRGTRIMVTNILGMMAGGYSAAGVIESYPELTKADVSAALDYASQIVNEEKVIAR